MKKVIDLSIGRVKFTLEEDAHQHLKVYLDSFEKTLDSNERSEIMQDIETRVAEIFLQEQDFSGQVVNLDIVKKVITYLGEIDMPDTDSTQTEKEHIAGKKTLHRDTDNKMIAGVCSGLGNYLNIDPTIIRIAFTILAIFVGIGFLLYIILWVLVPTLTIKGGNYTAGNKKLYRDTDNKMIAGICSGLGVYLNIDPTIIRIVFASLMIFAGIGFFIYLILWILVPRITTIAQQLELRGYATTAENIRKFKAENKIS